MVLKRAVLTYHLTRVRVASLVSRLPILSTKRPPGAVMRASAPSRCGIRNHAFGAPDCGSQAVLSRKRRTAKAALARGIALITSATDTASANSATPKNLLMLIGTPEQQEG